MSTTQNTRLAEQYGSAVMTWATSRPNGSIPVEDSQRPTDGSGLGAGPGDRGGMGVAFHHPQQHLAGGAGVFLQPDFTDLAEVEARLLAFERRYQQTATPFDWRFTRSDLDRLLRRLDDHEQLAQAA